ncbi:MAG: amidophosphoribosyltransferase [Myxococcota bacterium]
MSALPILSTDDRPHEECGIIAISAPDEDAARMAFFGLFALQHRGQEAAGIAVSDGSTARLHKDVGLVTHVFHPQDLKNLHGHVAIGHTRYSTTGSSSVRNAQPFLIETQWGSLGVAHNGNLVNAGQLRREVLERGVGLSSSSDSEVMTMMLAGAAGHTWEERIQSAMARWRGAYSLVILARDSVYAVRDPWGFRPLCVGRLSGGGHAVASETCALRTLGCESIREVAPGEIVHIRGKDLKSHQAMPAMPQTALCTFEHIYFSRPDSELDGLSIHQVRQRLGEELAREAGVPADVVVPVPDSSVPAAVGYARASGIPYNDGLIKNRYIGRTFIEPTDSLRKQGVAMKFNALEANLRGKRTVLIDDSIVRGNTSGPLVKLLRDAGATEVHLRITCPPIAHPCYMGVDMGTYDELLAHRLSLEQMRAHIGCDSLRFLSVEGMMRAIGRSSGYCNACFTGKYPIDVPAGAAKTGFEKAIG